MMHQDKNALTQLNSALLSEIRSVLTNARTLRDQSSTNDTQWDGLKEMFDKLEASEGPREKMFDPSALRPFIIALNQRLLRVLEVEPNRYDPSRFPDFVKKFSERSPKTNGMPLLKTRWRPTKSK